MKGNEAPLRSAKNSLPAGFEPGTPRSNVWSTYCLAMRPLLQPKLLPLCHTAAFLLCGLLIFSDMTEKDGKRQTMVEALEHEIDLCLESERPSLPS